MLACVKAIKSVILACIIVWWTGRTKTVLETGTIYVCNIVQIVRLGAFAGTAKGR